MTAPQPDSFRLSLRDGAMASLMVGMGETYLAAYTLALGFGEVAAGLITVLPVFIGSTLQLGSGLGARRLGSARQWILGCAIMQAVALFLLTAAVMLPPSLTLLFFAASMYWSAGLSIAPIWNIWISSVIPVTQHLHFFSSRGRIAQVFTLAGLVAAGLMLKSTENTVWQVKTFAALMLAAMFFRLASLHFLKQQPDTPSSNAVYEQFSLRSVFNQLTRRKSVFIITFLFLMNVAVYFSAPYFSPYMLRSLGLSYDRYMLLISSSFIAKALTYAWMVSLVRSRGLYALMLIGIIGIVPVPALWTLTNSYWLLVGIHALTGFVWGCFELGLTLLLLQHYSERYRAQVLAASHFFNAFGMAIGSIAAALYMREFGVQTATYHNIFLISAGLRALPLFMVPLFIHKSIKPIPIFLRSQGLKTTFSTIIKPSLTKVATTTKNPTKEQNHCEVGNLPKVP